MYLLYDKKIFSNISCLKMPCIFSDIKVYWMTAGSIFRYIALEGNILIYCPRGQYIANSKNGLVPYPMASTLFLKPIKHYQIMPFSLTKLYLKCSSLFAPENTTWNRMILDYMHEFACKSRVHYRLWFRDKILQASMW